MEVVKSRVKRLSEIMKEAESDCAAHTFKISAVDRKKPSAAHRVKLIAGLLRTIAENTDGWCANRGAVDRLLTTTGVIFSFTSDEKRDAFLAAVRVYIAQAIRLELEIEKV